MYHENVNLRGDRNICEEMRVATRQKERNKLKGDFFLNFIINKFEEDTLFLLRVLNTSQNIPPNLVAAWNIAFKARIIQTLKWILGYQELENLRQYAEQQLSYETQSPLSHANNLSALCNTAVNSVQAHVMNERQEMEKLIVNFIYVPVVYRRDSESPDQNRRAHFVALYDAAIQGIVVLGRENDRLISFRFTNEPITLRALVSQMRERRRVLLDIAFSIEIISAQGQLLNYALQIFFTQIQVIKVSSVRSDS